MQNDSLSMEPQHFLPLLILILSLILVTFFLIEFDQSELSLFQYFKEIYISVNVFRDTAIRTF